MLEANIRIQKEITELIFETLEKWFWNLVLDLGRQLVVKVEFFYDQIVIVHKSVLNKFFDWVVEPIWNPFFFVTVFKPKKPKVQLFHSCVDQAFKRLVAGEHDADGTRQEREEGEADEFHAHAEEQLQGGGTADVTVSNGSNSRENEVKSVCIYFNIEILNR